MYTVNRSFLSYLQSHTVFNSVASVPDLSTSFLYIYFSKTYFTQKKSLKEKYIFSHFFLNTKYLISFTNRLSSHVFLYSFQQYFSKKILAIKYLNETRKTNFTYGEKSFSPLNLFKKARVYFFVRLENSEGVI